jgi:hypothetical protein
VRRFDFSKQHDAYEKRTAWKAIDDWVNFCSKIGGIYIPSLHCQPSMKITLGGTVCASAHLSHSFCPFCTLSSDRVFTSERDDQCSCCLCHTTCLTAQPGSALSSSVGWKESCIISEITIGWQSLYNDFNFLKSSRENTSRTTQLDTSRFAAFVP